MMNGLEMAILCARVCDDHKARDIAVLEVIGLTDITDYMVIAEIDARPQVKAILNAIRKETKALGSQQIGIEGEDGARWVLIDFVDCVVHLLSPEAREYYELETLWGDGARIDWGGAEPQVAPVSGPVLHEATDDVG